MRCPIGWGLGGETVVPISDQYSHRHGAADAREINETLAAQPTLDEPMVGPRSKCLISTTWDSGQVFEFICSREVTFLRLAVVPFFPPEVGLPASPFFRWNRWMTQSSRRIL